MCMIGVERNLFIFLVFATGVFLRDSYGILRQGRLKGSTITDSMGLYFYKARCISTRHAVLLCQLELRFSGGITNGSYDVLDRENGMV